MTKYLDLTGLQKLIAKIVTYVSDAIAAIPTAVGGESGKDGLMSKEDKAKLEGIAANAQVNVIEKISVNGSNQTVTERGVDISVPTDLKDLVNTTTDFQSGSQVDSKIAAAISTTYKPAGSIAKEGIVGTLLAKENEGKVYNVTEEFTTDTNFVEGAGKKYPVGTNIVVINTSNGDSPSYKFDVLSGFINVDELATAALSEEEINQAWQAGEAAANED